MDSPVGNTAETWGGPADNLMERWSEWVSHFPCKSKREQHLQGYLADKKPPPLGSYRSATLYLFSSESCPLQEHEGTTFTFSGETTRCKVTPVNPVWDALALQEYEGTTFTAGIWALRAPEEARL